MNSPAGEMTGDTSSAGAAEPLPPFVRPRAAPTPARDAALSRVAERLERIAGMLRRGSSEELLARLDSAEEADPLDLLITGYALGHAQASRRAESDPAR
ncbi:MAG TPA: hypothetical protein VGR27_14380 [Longimicrobiaceae bacterium]|nr:hypothetical protein [Longimicrobiaceae bacterium]